MTQDYVCRCGNTWDIWYYGFDEPSKVLCPECNNPGRKVITAPGIELVGSGFYETDYKRTSSKTNQRADEKNDRDI